MLSVRSRCLSSLLLLACLGAQFPAGVTPGRLEFHGLPPVSTGPMDPDWSPDGSTIAFAARGEIWTIAPEGGRATALTRGRSYHAEPAWSPDGQHIALTYDSGERDYEIGLIDAAGSHIERLTDHPDYDLQPAWHPNGDSLYFASRREGSLDIYRLELSSRALTPVAAGRGNQIQPAVSPDGRWLAYVSPVAGRPGTGGLWILRLDNAGNAAAEPVLVHYEETEYRAAPTWAPDGRALLYVTENTGSNDIMLFPVGAGSGVDASATSGGAPVRLTWTPGHELSPTPSPDGERIAFVSNRNGAMRLFTMPAGGGGKGGLWEAVSIDDWRWRVPMGRLSGRVLGANGVPTPARVWVTGADGRGYAPQGGFYRRTWSRGADYFHSLDAEDGFELELPEGEARIEVTRGFEYQPVVRTVDIAASSTAIITTQLERLDDAPARGWFSGDTHSHDLHQGRQGLTREEFFGQLVADDLHVTNALIHMDGTRLMGRWEDLTGEPSVLSTPENILFYTQEFRGSFSHVGMLGLQRFITPLIGGAPGTPHAEDVLKLDYVDKARAQGGLGGFVHPYNGPVDTVEQAAGADIPVHVALGRADFYDVVSIASREDATTEMYYRFLNCGFRLTATGGTDNFSDVWLDPSPGTARVYVKILDRARDDGEGGSSPLTYARWLDGIRNGRTFATSGPLLYFQLDGQDPGSTIDLAASHTGSLEASIELVSMVPIDRVEIVVNGEVVHTLTSEGDGTRLVSSVAVDVPDGGWVAARAVGPPHRWVGDHYPYVHTSPVYVTREGRRATSAEDARFLMETVRELWRRVQERDHFVKPASKAAYELAIEEALAVYRGISESSAR